MASKLREEIEKDLRALLLEEGGNFYRVYTTERDHMPYFETRDGAEAHQHKLCIRALYNVPWAHKTFDPEINSIDLVPLDEDNVDDIMFSILTHGTCSVNVFS